MKDLISIIVPIYNVEKYLNKCIESIVNQTYENIEIILIDDGSNDNSGIICDEYAKKDNRIIVVHKENGGVSSARNKGLKIAKGEWISFVDADDWIEQTFCQTLLNKVTQEQADIALCGYNRITDNRIEKINANNQEVFLNSNEYLVKSLNPQTGFGFCHMKLIKKEVLKSISFNERIEVGEDALFNIQLSTYIKKAVFLKQPLYNYRINNQSVVKRYDENYANKYLKSMKIIEEYIWQEYNEENEENIEIKQNYYNFVAYHIMLIIVNYCYHPDNKMCNAQRKNMLKEVINNDLFIIGLKKSNYNNISLTRKITLYTLKHKLYWLTAIICKIRQKQNRKK
ncbi:glycosyltransferase group 2 family protein [Clostridium sp. CAG:440]|jgi:glycosyltransferase involved in cell wall biosynthesis|nr:glycosyltransferase group 2 family protein [Clostridium sp. CAG:440]